MKIAITSENNQVFQHFGHTPGFTVFTVEEGRITGKALLPSGENGHGALATLLAENNVELLIAGGIGGGAQMALANAGIRLIGGASGDVDAVMNAYLAGNLHTRPDFQCHHHEHQAGHTCGGTCGKTEHCHD